MPSSMESLLKVTHWMPWTDVTEDRAKKSRLRALRRFWRVFAKLLLKSTMASAWGRICGLLIRISTALRWFIKMSQFICRSLPRKLNSASPRNILECTGSPQGNGIEPGRLSEAHQSYQLGWCIDDLENHLNANTVTEQGVLLCLINIQIGERFLSFLLKGSNLNLSKKRNSWTS